MPRSETYSYEPYGSIPAGIENITLSDTVTYAGVKAFSVDADGTLAVKMADGSSGTIVVKAGVQYAGDVIIFKSTGSVTTAAVTIFY